MISTQNTKGKLAQYAVQNILEIQISALLRSSVVYRYKCAGCSARYYGKTSRNLAMRCREHIGVTKAGYKINNNLAQSVVDTCFGKHSLMVNWMTSAVTRIIVKIFHLLITSLIMNTTRIPLRQIFYEN